MKPGEFELDMAGMMRALSQSEALNFTRTKASAVVAEAKATGPRGAHSGVHQIDLLEVGESRVTDDGAVTDIDWHSHEWHIIERGSVNNPPYRPLTRAAQNQGLRVVDF